MVTISLGFIALSLEQNIAPYMKGALLCLNRKLKNDRKQRQLSQGQLYSEPTVYHYGNLMGDSCLHNLQSKEQLITSHYSMALWGFE